MKKYQRIVLAGTFDHLHLGHQSFIKTALDHSLSASCGLTTGWANNSKLLASEIESFKQRYHYLNKFLAKNGFLARIKVFPLNDPYGSAVADDFDAIAATQDSLKGAKAVNKKRRAKGLKPLPIIIVDLVKAKDKKNISSTRIRLGQINRQGLVYQQSLTKSVLYLPLSQRPYFKKPIGQLLTGDNLNLSWASTKALRLYQKTKPALIITVGDITTQALFLNQIPVNLAIVDHRCQRQPIAKNFHLKLKQQADFFNQTKNYPGTIYLNAVNVLNQALNKILKSGQKGLIEVDGEEDLLVLPLILLSPLNTAIFYGQPHQGLVAVKVTERLKNKVFKLISKFK